MDIAELSDPEIFIENENFNIDDKKITDVLNKNIKISDTLSSSNTLSSSDTTSKLSDIKGMGKDYIRIDKYSSSDKIIRELEIEDQYENLFTDLEYNIDFSKFIKPINIYENMQLIKDLTFATDYEYPINYDNYLYTSFILTDEEFLILKKQIERRLQRFILGINNYKRNLLEFIYKKNNEYGLQYYISYLSQQMLHNHSMIQHPLKLQKFENDKEIEFISNILTKDNIKDVLRYIQFMYKNNDMSIKKILNYCVDFKHVVNLYKMFVNIYIHIKLVLESTGGISLNLRVNRKYVKESINTQVNLLLKQGKKYFRGGKDVVIPVYLPDKKDQTKIITYRQYFMRNPKSMVVFFKYQYYILDKFLYNNILFKLNNVILTTPLGYFPQDKKYIEDMGNDVICFWDYIKKLNNLNKTTILPEINYKTYMTFYKNLAIRKGFYGIEIDYISGFNYLWLKYYYDTKDSYQNKNVFYDYNFVIEKMKEMITYQK